MGNSDSTSLSWRLLRHGPTAGGVNMAVDEAVAQAVAARRVPPTLRLYAWAPPCVSLGRNQSANAVDHEACERLGYDIVRRPTGGRAILHVDELTYSVAAPADHPMVAGLVLEAYLRLSRGLLAGLLRLGIQAEAAPGTNRPGPDVSAACFEVPSAYEIVVGGRKLMGSAQNRRAGYVLQHGSLPLYGDVSRLVECLAFEREDARIGLRSSLAEHATTVETVTGRRVGFEEAQLALSQGFADALRLHLAPGELTESEQERVEALVQEKYGSELWTSRT